MRSRLVWVSALTLLASLDSTSRPSLAASIRTNTAGDDWLRRRVLRLRQRRLAGHFLVNGSRLEGFAAGQTPTSHLLKNNRDNLTDVTARALRMLDGPGCLYRGHDNDGFEDLFVTYFGKDVLTTTTERNVHRHERKAGVAGSGKRWNTVALLSIRSRRASGSFVAIIDLDLATAPVPGVWSLPVQGSAGGVRPPGLNGGRTFYHNNGDGTFPT
jgi:hypothetical protein